MKKAVYLIIDEFLKLPIGTPIDFPNERVDTGIRLGHVAFEIFGLTSASVFFARKSLKHICEKKIDAYHLVSAIREVISMPLEIRKSRQDERFLVITQLKGERRQTVLVLEIIPNAQAFIVTIFKSDPDYLSNFELLWRTEGLAS